jgi:hypothetical protein
MASGSKKSRRITLEEMATTFDGFGKEPCAPSLDAFCAAMRYAAIQCRAASNAPSDWLAKHDASVIAEARMQGVKDAIGEIQKSMAQGAKWQEAVGALVFYANNLSASHPSDAPQTKTQGKSK